MVFIAIDKNSGALIHANKVSHTKSVKRKLFYYCTCCNDNLSYVKEYTRNKITVKSHFRHEKNSDCVIEKNNDSIYLNDTKRYVNKWLSQIDEYYIYAQKIKGQIIDVVNNNNDHIYIKYSLCSKETIKNKINDIGRIIWILSMNNRPHKIYEVMDTNKILYLLSIESKTDLVDFNLSECDVYLDSDSMYKMVANDEKNEKVFYTGEHIPVVGHLVKKILIKNFIEDIGDIFKNEFEYEPEKSEEIKPLYTKKFFISVLRGKIYDSGLNYDMSHLDNIEVKDLSEIELKIDELIRKQEEQIQEHMKMKKTVETKFRDNDINENNRINVNLLSELNVRLLNVELDRKMSAFNAQYFFDNVFKND